MLNHLIAWSLAHRPAVLALGVLLLVAGIWSAARAPIDVFPDLTAPSVTVLVEAPGMAPEEIESIVTFPLEAALNGATDVRRVRSSTVTGIAVIWVEFDWGVELFRARQVVVERMQPVARGFPEGVLEPTLAPISSIMGEILMIGVTGPGDPGELRSLGDWTIRPRLLGIPGVAQVVPMGGDVREYQVLVDPERLAAAGVPLGDVIAAAWGAGRNAPGGVVVDSGQEFLVRGLGRVRNVADLESVPVAVQGGVPVRLDQVARVVVGPAPRFGDASVNARPGLVLAVQKQPGANTLELTRRVERELASLAPTLPTGVELHGALFRQSVFIERAIDNVSHALRDGALLVIVILAIFLWNLRATTISVLAIPLSLATALLAMRALGLSLNTMSLGGMAIAIGALVDDAIIDVENVDRRLKENRALPEEARRPTLTVVYEASREIRASIVNATAIILIVFLPLFFLGGVEGRLLQPLGLAYVVSLLASLIVAVTVTPVLASYWMAGRPDAPHRGDSAVVRVLKRIYTGNLDVVLRHPRRVVVAAGVAFALSLACVPLLGTAFLPEFNEGALTISVVTPPGTSLDEAGAIGRRVEEILLGHPEVLSTDRRQGRAELDEHAQGVNAAELDVSLAPDIDRERLLEALRAEFTQLPGTNVTIGQPIGHRIDHMLSGTRANIAVKIFGPDRLELRRLGTEVAALLQGVPGLVDVQLEQQLDVPELHIVPDRTMLAAYGLSPGQFSNRVTTLLRGSTVATVFESGRPVPLVVRLPEEFRASAETIGAVRLDTPSGARVRLDQLATIRYDRGPNAISRENGLRKIVVQANVAGRDLGSAVEETRARIASGVAWPTGYHVEFGGQFESQIAASRRLGILSLFALAAVFLVLYGEFRSSKLALLLLVNLPLALIGGILAVLATDRIVSVASLVGFITLFGIATRNGILMLTHYQHLRSEGKSLRDAIHQGSLERLSPILMTALTAGLALIPLVLAGGKPGNELQAPIAVVILGGLLSSTALNMVVVPALYRLMADPDEEGGASAARRPRISKSPIVTIDS
jgi:CzcA family heavy metal efflux pump